MAYFFLALIAVFLAVLLIRAALFRPKAQPQCSAEAVDFDRNKAISALQTLVRCKTVSHVDPAQEDEAEFRKLLNALHDLYPRVFDICSVRELPDRALLIRWPGKGKGDPTVLMAHYDVVPADDAQWEKPPFEGIIEDGVLWGRGTLDTKVTVNGILSAANHLIAQGYQPAHDVFFAFSGGEEVAGKGAPNIVDWLEKHDIRPALVLDEGGAVVQNVFPGVKAPCGMIGIAEKGMMNVEFKVHSGGGHASSPPPATPIDILARGCTRLLNHPFPMHLTRASSEMFDTLGRYSTFGLKIVFANLWCFGPVLDLICRKTGGELNALVRTTQAFTMAQGSQARNVIPPEASLVANIRLNPADSVASALAHLKQTLRDPRVEVRVLESFPPSPISQTDCPAWDKVASSVAETWEDTVVTPYLMVQCSDSRHFGRLCDHVYRFSAMDLTSEERKTIHGNNERIRLDCACRAVEFYIRLLKKC